jgi:formamidopyrimidine-DNA glycosylase
MPELPEVERARRAIERAGEGRRIVRAIAADDALVIVPGARAVEDALHGKRIERVLRRGKWMWLELDAPPHVLVHLGMSGAWHVRGEVSLAYRTGAKTTPSWPPRFAKLTLALDDGGELVLSDARRLGRVILRDDPTREAPIAELGFDPLLDMPTLKQLRDRMARRRGPIKGLLLDQTFSAGIGNWVADEVLYQAALDPRAEIGSLSDDEVKRLHAAIRKVVKIAVAKNAESDRFPRSWLFHHRWEKGTRTAKGEPIRHIVVAGRTTAFVPTVQKPRRRAKKKT